MFEFKRDYDNRIEYSGTYNELPSDVRSEIEETVNIKSCDITVMNSYNNQRFTSVFPTDGDVIGKRLLWVGKTSILSKRRLVIEAEYTGYDLYSENNEFEDRVNDLLCGNENFDENDPELNGFVKAVYDRVIIGNERLVICLDARSNVDFERKTDLLLCFLYFGVLNISRRSLAVRTMATGKESNLGIYKVIFTKSQFRDNFATGEYTVIDLGDDYEPTSANSQLIDWMRAVQKTICENNDMWSDFDAFTESLTDNEKSIIDEHGFISAGIYASYLKHCAENGSFTGKIEKLIESFTDGAATRLRTLMEEW